MFGSDARVDNEYRLNIRSLSTSKYKAMLLLLVSGAVLAVVGGVDVKSAEYTTCSALAVSAAVRKKVTKTVCVREAAVGEQLSRKTTHPAVGAISTSLILISDLHHIKNRSDRRHPS